MAGDGALNSFSRQLEVCSVADEVEHSATDADCSCASAVQLPPVVGSLKRIALAPQRSSALQI